MPNRRRLHAAVIGALILGSLVASPHSALGQPGFGSGGIDVSPGMGNGGSNITVQGSYVQVPSASPGTGGSPGASAAGTGGGGSGYSGGGSDVVSAPTGPPIREQLKACGRFTDCVPLSPDVGMPATPVAMAQVMNVVGTAITGMQLEKPPMCSTPEPADYAGGRTGLVGRWAWYYLCPDQIRESTVGPVSRTAVGPGLLVSATAFNTSVTVNPGDGSLPIVCSGALLPFTPYTDLVDASPLTPPSGMPSPTCGRHMEKTSITEPDSTFHVSATSGWTIFWTAAFASGQTIGGVVPVPLTTQFRQRVGELQVLVTPNVGGNVAGAGAAVGEVVRPR